MHISRLSHFARESFVPIKMSATSPRRRIAIAAMFLMMLGFVSYIVTTLVMSPVSHQATRAAKNDVQRMTSSTVASDSKPQPSNEATTTGAVSHLPNSETVPQAEDRKADQQPSRGNQQETGFKQATKASPTPSAAVQSENEQKPSGGNVQKNNGRSSSASDPASAVNAPRSNTIVRTTGYGYPDNDPPGSAAIARQVVHTRAGGVGTYEDPITVAVRMNGNYRIGQRIYFPDFRRYGIVEDFCGACTSSSIDIWVGGNGSNNSRVLSCERAITGTREIIVSPPRGLPIEIGEMVSSSYCNR